MRKSIHWDKWGLIPAALLIAGMVAILLRMDPTAAWAVHFNWDGTPNRFANVGELFYLAVIAFVVFFAMAAMDEGLVQLGIGKWNVAGAIGTFSSAILFGAIFMIFRAGPEPGSHLPGGHAFLLLGFALFCGGLALALDMLRRYPEPEIESPPFTLPDLTRKNWAYWERFRLPWVDVLLATTFLPIAAGVWLFSPSKPLVFQWMTTAFLVLPLLFLGGMTLVVNRERLVVRFGLFRIPLFRVRLARIHAVREERINPIRDFGGLGIRYSFWRGWGVIFGRDCVAFTSSSGRKITVSSRRPALLAALLDRLAKDAD